MKLSAVLFSFSGTKYAAKMTIPKTYQNAIAALNSLQSNAQAIEKARKERDQNAAKNVPWVTKLLSYLGIQVSDLDKLNIIHVSGTKGKGSTCAFTESLLRHSGYRTGFFSSPHLVSVRERIRLCGKPIDEDLFTQYFWEVYERLENNCAPDEMPPYFKFLTVLSFYVFLKEKVDAAVVEVGIGGRYDCTNVVQHPGVCGVSSLGYDHISLLGDTLSKIAHHKAGIFKPGCPAITVPQPDEARDVLEQCAKSTNTPLYTIPPLESYPTNNGPLHLGLEGLVQSVNASLALQLYRIWMARQKDQQYIPPHKNGTLLSTRITDIEKNALESCSWPGRFQRISRGNVDFYLDGAHTKESVKYCAEWFKTVKDTSGNTRRFLLFNSTADRDPASLLSPLKEVEFTGALFSPNILDADVRASSDLANFTVEPDHQMKRCLLQANIWKSLAGETDQVVKCFGSVREAVEWITTQSGEEKPVQVLVTGSLHLVGAVLSILDPSLDHCL